MSLDICDESLIHEIQKKQWLLTNDADAQDPNITIVDGKEVPYELHYAQKMTHYLSLRAPDASPVLKTAIRAQRMYYLMPH